MAAETKEEKKFTPEEMRQRRLNLMEFYKEQTEFLTLQKNYEQLVTELEELRTRFMVAQVRQAQMAPPPEEELNGVDLTKDTGVMPNVETNKLATNHTEPGVADGTKRQLKKSEKV